MRDMCDQWYWRVNVTRVTSDIKELMKSNTENLPTRSESNCSHTLSHTLHSYRRGQSEVPLETRLVQKRVYHCCSAENGSLSASGQLSIPNWTTTVSIVSTLRRRRRDSTASAPVLSDSHASTHLHQLHQLYRPTTHDELPGDDWGGDTSPRSGMRERERERE